MLQSHQTLKDPVRTVRDRVKEELTHSEVRGCQGVGSVTILTVGSGGVPLLSCSDSCPWWSPLQMLGSKTTLMRPVWLLIGVEAERKNNKHISLVSMNLPWKV